MPSDELKAAQRLSEAFQNMGFPKDAADRAAGITERDTRTGSIDWSKIVEGAQ